MIPTLAGQWIDNTTDHNSDCVVLDLDEEPEGLRGTGRLFFSDGRPGALCELSLPHAFENWKTNVLLRWIDPSAASWLSPYELAEKFSNLAFPRSATIQLKFKNGDLDVSWHTDVNTSGSAKLTRSDMTTVSDISSTQMSWSEFKDFSLENNIGGMIFRGQPDRYKLRTAFHRTNRKDLLRYALEDEPVLHRQLTAQTRHFFNLSSPAEKGAFWNLLQHHGYPTPLLDWSYSPFVAAFFAFRNRLSRRELTEYVRILIFDKRKWESRFNQIDSPNLVRPHFSTLETMALENPRSIPQQALSTLTNIDDIEGYISMREKELSQTFLTAIDIEASSRSKVMAELSLMGITAGSLFPGLDGACEQLRSRFFN